jgi:hypothetical protein
MKTILFALTLMLFTSCSEKEIMLQVCSTGEKVLMYNDIYHLGDTVVLEQTVDPVGELCFEIDNNWVKFNESHKYLGDNGYYKAVVIN